MELTDTPILFSNNNLGAFFACYMTIFRLQLGAQGDSPPLRVEHLSLLRTGRQFTGTHFYRETRETRETTGTGKKVSHAYAERIVVLSILPNSST